MQLLLLFVWKRKKIQISAFFSHFAILDIHGWNWLPG